MEATVQRSDIPRVEGLDDNQVLTLVYCRSYKQYLSMIDGYRVGKCAFCDLDPERNRVVRSVGVDDEHEWRMWVNQFPLPNTSLHLIMASRRHIAPGGDVTANDFLAMGELFLWAQQQYEFTGGGFAMRFGSPLQSSGTVLHLHANIIVPNLKGVVEVTLAKEPAKIAEQVARMRVFERLRAGISVEDLEPEEQKLVEGRLK